MSVWVEIVWMLDLFLKQLRHQSGSITKYLSANMKKRHAQQPKVISMLYTSLCQHKRKASLSLNSVINWWGLHTWVTQSLVPSVNKVKHMSWRHSNTNQRWCVWWFLQYLALSLVYYGAETLTQDQCEVDFPPTSRCQNKMRWSLASRMHLSSSPVLVGWTSIACSIPKFTQSDWLNLQMLKFIVKKFIRLLWRTRKLEDYNPSLPVLKVVG